MASIEKYLPVYRELEGGLSRNTYDTASNNPCPTSYFGETGYHTNSGITWTLWSKVIGSDIQATERWFKMSDSDLAYILKKEFWDVCQADSIISQRIANEIVDWVINSGRVGELDTQKIINTLFNGHLTIDGCFGSLTINAINSANEIDLYNDILEKRKSFFEDIVKNNPSQQTFLKGWEARIDKLTAYNSTLS